jgi:hypothetical protein
MNHIRENLFFEHINIIYITAQRISSYNNYKEVTL